MSYYTKTCVYLFMFYFVVHDYLCLKIIPERAKVTHFDKNYLEDSLIFNVRRYNRKGEYYLNMFFENKIVLGNGITVDIIFYEYLHNEFRRSFPEMHFKLCGLINKDPYIGKSLRAAGFPCPVLLGKHDISNLTFNPNIPSLWPFEKGMVEVIVKNENDLLIASGEVVLTFKQDLPKLKV